MPRILVVDDSDEVREVVKTVLVLKDFSVLEAFNGRQALAFAQKEAPDLIILDLMLPDIDGTEVCKALRQNSKTSKIPVLMLTARAGVFDRVKGLELGADDYLVKPFETLELMARVNALLRRSGGNEIDKTRAPLKVDLFEMNPASYTLSIGGKSVSGLTPREFDILYMLVKNTPNPVTRENIFQTIWGKEDKNQSRVIDIHVAKIRKKIGPEHIKTIPGKGYLLSTNG